MYDTISKPEAFLFLTGAPTTSWMDIHEHKQPSNNTAVKSPKAQK